MDGGIGIVAIGIVFNITGRCRTSSSGDAGISMAVTVAVCVVDIDNAFVNFAVAVVVNFIANFFDFGVDGGIGIVTIGVVIDIANRRLGIFDFGGVAGVAVTVPIAVKIVCEHVGIGRVVTITGRKQ
jgi:hypothetical protein